MNCPLCQKELTPKTDADGVTRAFCDCAGFRRPVIEIIPPEEVRSQNAEVRIKPKTLRS
jgi:hypothetical protein